MVNAEEIAKLPTPETDRQIGKFIVPEGDTKRAVFHWNNAIDLCRSLEQRLAAAVDALELTLNCDLIYAETFARGTGDWDSERTVKDVVEETLSAIQGKRD